MGRHHGRNSGAGPAPAAGGPGRTADGARRRPAAAWPRSPIRVRCAVPPVEAAARLWEADRHTAVIPFTRLDHHGRLDRPGLRFTARTALGPVGFDDVMVVREADAGRVVIDKVGRWITGTVEAGLLPCGAGSQLEWRQQIRVLGLGWAQAIVDVVAHLAYAVALRALLRTPRR